MHALTTSATITITVSTITTRAFSSENAIQGICCHNKKENYKYNALYVHIYHNISVITNAATHAMIHWETRIINAQVEPNSLRIVAIAAMHGV